MGLTAIFVLCSFAVATAQSPVTLKADVPFVSVHASQSAELECCYITAGTAKKVTPTWVRTFKYGSNTVGPLRVKTSATVGQLDKRDSQCGTLTLASVQLNDTGLYQCLFNSQILSYGTYLQVYWPLKKTINLSESTKNKILTAEGFLLLLCMLLPTAGLLFKSKKLHELEKKKAAKEEENIYQGLNLDDCCSTYDQIERPPASGPYQDVCNFMEEEEEIQLEKP
ncbi:B-cell antigen receptor complex-associated protein alpha chain [Solea senegalensis]|uniref:B-cell antigen receptor complex-associated protein alpha chain n=1 Tax=Solea senegalensis TaxID=28829 RepID=A0AAV6PRP7_SOLSE|nr:B-cell antigen receptor complex-associated protein alpha chain [Solea senegalensis]KAG7475050.1 B-cell antigen receptor complex-associated protein alpha chain [Solea senegalensis]